MTENSPSLASKWIPRLQASTKEHANQDWNFVRQQWKKAISRDRQPSPIFQAVNAFRKTILGAQWSEADTAPYVTDWLHKKAIHTGTAIQRVITLGGLINKKRCQTAAWLGLGAWVMTH